MVGRSWTSIHPPRPLYELFDAGLDRVLSSAYIDKLQGEPQAAFIIFRLALTEQMPELMDPRPVEVSLCLTGWGSRLL